jgi:hypothetical protein
MIVNYRFWNKIRNCGDAIMAYILQDVLDATPMRVDGDVPHLLGVGSIFFLANEQSHVWGSGLLRPEHGENLTARTEQIYAVRGQRTLDFLKETRGVADLPLGDPGILVDRLVDTPEFRAMDTTHEIAFVPHYSSLSSPEVQAYAQQDNVCLVDMRDASLNPLEQIHRAEIVVSQSLHGLVFASALGKKNAWISANDTDQWAFKFRDWFSTVDNPQSSPLPMDAGIDAFRGAAELRDVAVDRDALIAAFPADAVRAQDESPLLDFRSSRRVAPVVLRYDWKGPLTQTAPTAFVETRDGRNLAKRVRGAIEPFFARWSEIPYVCLAPHGMRLDDATLDSLAQYMDRKPSVDALMVLPRERRDSTGKGGTEPTFGFDVATSLEAVDGMLLIRPSTTFNFKRRIWNVFI